ncbi:MAG: PhnA domain-containing protein [Thiohalomonadales bacterium]
MQTEKIVQERSGSKCELCAAKEGLGIYVIPPSSTGHPDECIHLCGNCQVQVDNLENMQIHHWHCLKDSMWSQVPAVQVMAWRMLTRLHGEAWANDLLDMLYLDEATLAWAKSADNTNNEETLKHLDSYGTVLNVGDTVTLIKDLNVKGGNFTAKRGTAVRGISLVPENAEQIEGRVNGQQIVILTKFVKKAQS